MRAAAVFAALVLDALSAEAALVRLSVEKKLAPSDGFVSIVYSPVSSEQLATTGFRQLADYATRTI